MRWKKMQALKASSEEEADVVEAEAEEEDASALIKIPLKLTSEQAATSNYTLGPPLRNPHIKKI